MGLIKFAIDKGKDLFDKKDDDATKAVAIRKEVEDLGLDEAVEDDFRVIVEGEKVKLEGKAPDQETKEKILLAAGNITGVAEVEDAMTASETTFYTVKSGDTLSKIARRYLGSARLYPEIFEANRPMLTHPDKIYPGQVLRIPGTKQG
ncbi:MAG: peptidoglycan-binding protein LysM [Hyphomonadaceae bacterium]|nr:peptidoglycan-binding protein LysM [Hyphomonadaceae bacterium]